MYSWRCKPSAKTWMQSCDLHDVKHVNQKFSPVSWHSENFSGLYDLYLVLTFNIPNCILKPNIVVPVSTTTKPPNPRTDFFLSFFYCLGGKTLKHIIYIFIFIFRWRNSKIICSICCFSFKCAAIFMGPWHYVWGKLPVSLSIIKIYHGIFI